MAVVTFYGKPGCVNNARQQRLLLEAGHQVVVRDLLGEPWSPQKLGRFVDDLPVTDWFNPSSPRVRCGEVCPEQLNADEALALLVRDPLLIRRPLMEAGGETMVGFDPERVNAWLGLAQLPEDDVETCVRKGEA